MGYWPEKKPRGFALLSAAERRAMASRGGSSVNPENRAFARDRKLAAQAGRIGGKHLKNPPR